jgi:hypothetical protein
MKTRKPKEPSLRDKLAKGFVEAFQSDFEANGIAAIEALRKESPAKYAEIAARLIAATEPQSQAEGILGANSSEDIGRRLLQSLAALNHWMSKSSKQSRPITTSLPNLKPSRFVPAHKGNRIE